MATAARYKMIGVTRGGGGVIERTVTGAPSESKLVGWAAEKGCGAAIRYYPSKRGWGLYDVRRALPVMMGRAKVWRNFQRSTRYWPTEDAAVMAAVHMLAGHS